MVTKEIRRGSKWREREWSAEVDEPEVLRRRERMQFAAIFAVCCNTLLLVIKWY